MAHLLPKRTQNPQNTLELLQDLMQSVLKLNHWHKRQKPTAETNEDTNYRTSEHNTVPNVMIL